MAFKGGLEQQINVTLITKSLNKRLNAALRELATANFFCSIKSNVKTKKSD
jgi:hypothetical protein